MANTFKRLSDVTPVDTMPANAKVLVVSDNGEIYKAPASKSSGGGARYFVISSHNVYETSNSRSFDGTLIHGDAEAFVRSLADSNGLYVYPEDEMDRVYRVVCGVGLDTYNVAFAYAYGNSGGFIIRSATGTVLPDEV